MGQSMSVPQIWYMMHQREKIRSWTRFFSTMMMGLTVGYLNQKSRDMKYLTKPPDRSGGFVIPERSV